MNTSDYTKLLTDHHLTPFQYANSILEGVSKAGAVYSYIDRNPKIKSLLSVHTDLQAKHILHLIIHKIDRIRKCKICNQDFEKYPKASFMEPILTCSRNCTNLYRHGETSPFSRSSVQEKKKNTVKERYGVDNIFQDKSIISKIKTVQSELYGGMGNGSILTSQKIQNTHLEKYGTKFAISSQFVRNKIKTTFDNKYGTEPLLIKEIQDKAKLTRLEKYGVSNPYLVPGAQERALITKRTHELALLDTRLNDKNFKIINRDSDKVFIDNGFGNVTVKHIDCGHIMTIESSCFGFRSLCKKCWISKPQREIYEFLKSLISDDIIINDRIQLNGKELDLWIPLKRLAIEVNGIYWHRDTENQSNISHKNKTDNCTLKDIALLHIFDFEWIHRKLIVQSIIKNKLGLSTKVYARKLDIKTITSHEAAKFFNDNHLTGHIHASKYIALVMPDSGKIIQAISVGTPRFSKDKTQLEIYRSATLIDHIVIGGFEKLIKSIRNLFPNRKLLSYIDRRYFNGSSYIKAGFTLEKITSPNYWYVKNDKMLNRLQTQKHKLNEILDNFDESKTEYENMISNGYFKFSDSGNLRMIL